MSNNKLTRAFLAIEPPTEIRKEIGNIQNNLKKLCPFDVRWVKPEGIHLTLKFFGDVSEEAITAISWVVEENTAITSPLHLKVNKLGLFPSQRRPRVIWIGLEGETASLFSLQDRMERGLETVGYAKEDRPFRAHLTLGRIKAPNEAGALAKIIEDGGDRAAGNFLASGLVLFKSDLTPRGAIYTKLAWFPFSTKVNQILDRQ
jgi:2'-5' RNA ligase